MSQQLKIALVHDYIKEYGGAERVLEELHMMYPDAPVYTLLYAPNFLGPHKARFKNWKIKTSFLQYVPFSYKFISIFRIIAPFVFSQFNFSHFNIILVSATGAYNPNCINKKSANLICYCHTPPRYLYGYATARETKKNSFMKFGLLLMSHFLRIVDFKASQNVDTYIANSKNVAERIKKFYKKDAVVIYPPIELQQFAQQQVTRGNGNFYLAGGRLARPKHIDLIVRVCSKQNIPLKVFGKGFAGYGEELHRIAGNTVEFLGEISDSKKIELMKEAKAFFFAAEDEDFGIIPVEAMAAGIPVIAYYSGGVKETVIAGKTGIFFHELSEESLNNAISQFEKSTIRSQDCIEQAEKFSSKKFAEKIKNIIYLQQR